MDDNANAIFEGLNPQQKDAVSHIEGPVLIVAGAGSGKTRVLTCRIANLLAHGVPAGEILALTFTKKAAEEMKERVAAMVGRRNAWGLAMGTFHSVFARFLREWSGSLGYPKDFTIYDTSDSVSMIKTCLKELNLDDKVYKPKNVLARISEAKNSLVSPASYMANSTAVTNDAAAKMPRISEVYDLYWRKCRQCGVMDFDDILFQMNVLLRDNPAALEALSGRFTHIMVDEYQDTNRAQYLILKKLAERHRNICVVGDDSQSIYAFRGARVENILRFQKDYPETAVFRLERNYRSTRTIVDAANSLIAHNENRIPKTCFSEGDEGEPIRLIKAYTEVEEAALIVSSIADTLRRDQAEYQDFAVLYRTNAQSRAIEEALRRRNIPYIIYSGNSFFERAEVKDVMAYLKLVCNPSDDESFKRAVGKPSRGIGDTSLAALAAAGLSHGVPLMQAAYLEDLETFGLKKAAVAKIRLFTDMMLRLNGRSAASDAYDLVMEMMNESGLMLHFKSDLSVEGQARLANVDELCNSVKNYVEEQQAQALEDAQYADAVAGADAYGGDDVSGGDAYGATAATGMPGVTLGGYLENVALLTAVDVEEDPDSSNKVALMTAHSSKGLEFPYVYIAGMEENLFPSGGLTAKPSDIEEERRLFYVALTRAKKAVKLSFASSRMRNGRTESNSVSRFVHEIDSKYIANPLADDMKQVRADSFWAGINRSEVGSLYGDRSRGASSGRPSGASSDAYSGRPSGASSGRPAWAQGRGGIPGGGQPSGASSGRPVYSRPQGSGSGLGRVQGGGFSRGASSSDPRATVAPSQRPRFTKPAQRVPDEAFTPSPVMDLREGQRVEHIRFGFGVIKSLNFQEDKACIAFDDYGEKILLLKFAKIRII